MKKIWYPGSSYANEEWIKYLQNSFKGNWLFSDINEFSDWMNLPGERKIIDTFNYSQLKMEVDILIISRHPGLRTSEEVVLSNILDEVSPQKFIYDPGANNGDIQEHLNAAKIFIKLGYDLRHIIVLPSLQHQLCEFDKV
jgi:hypothetical protein